MATLGRGRPGGEHGEIRPNLQPPRGHLAPRRRRQYSGMEHKPERMLLSSPAAGPGLHDLTARERAMPRSRDETRIYNKNRFKLGLFGMNCQGVRRLTISNTRSD